jgi:putative membrane protein
VTLPGDPIDLSTRLALVRTRLAFERTLMAWVRTSVSLITFGFTLYKAFE